MGEDRALSDARRVVDSGTSSCSNGADWVGASGLEDARPIECFDFEALYGVLMIRVKKYWWFPCESPRATMEYEIGADESVSVAVVRAVSAVDGREPCSLPPLSHVIDTDALDVLFDPQSDGHTRRGGRVSFVYDHCRVTIDNGEYLTIHPLDKDPGAVSSRDSDSSHP